MSIEEPISILFRELPRLCLKAKKLDSPILNELLRNANLEVSERRKSARLREDQSQTPPALLQDQ